MMQPISNTEDLKKSDFILSSFIVLVERIDKFMVINFIIDFTCDPKIKLSERMSPYNGNIEQNHN